MGQLNHGDIEPMAIGPLHHWTMRQFDYGNIGPLVMGILDHGTIGPWRVVCYTNTTGLHCFVVQKY